MDDERRIRLQVAPFIFFASLGWGVLLNYQIIIKTIGISSGDCKVSEWQPLVQLFAALVGLAGAGALVIASGFIIVSATNLMLRLLMHAVGAVMKWRVGYKRAGWCPHLILTPDAMKRIRKKYIESDSNSFERYDFYAIIAFDHWFIRGINEGSHRWLVRCWSGVIISLSNTIAVLFSYLVLLIEYYYVDGMRVGALYWIVTVFLCAIFLAQAYFSWKDYCMMMEFQAIIGRRKSQEYISGFKARLNMRAKP